MNILVTRLQNVGDMLAFIPALKTLRGALPDAYITLLGKHSGGIEIVRDCPYIDNLVVVRDRSLREKLRLIRIFRRLKLDYFLVSTQDVGRVPWALMGGAKKIVAFEEVIIDGRRKRQKLPRWIDIAPEYPEHGNEVESNTRLARALLNDLGEHGGQEQVARLDYGWITDRAQQKAAEVLEEYTIEGPYLVSAPVTPKQAAKEWPRDRLFKLYRRVHDEWGWRVVLVGGAAERDMMQDWPGELGPWCHLLAGETSLMESAALMQRAELFLGIDSGPAFLASAVQLPAVVLFGPGDFDRWRLPASISNRVDIVYRRDCSPCKHFTCPLDNPCMADISVEEVWQALEKLKKPA